MSEAQILEQPTPRQALLDGSPRARDLAQSLGISEAELLSDHGGPEAVRLSEDIPGLVNSLPSLGEIMSLVRNEAAVHEKVGRFDNITLGVEHGLVLNGDIDQRLFMTHWRFAFAVDLPGKETPRRSLQIFDERGDAIVKIHMRTSSDHAAFESIRGRFADGARPMTVVTGPEDEPAPAAPDVAAFRSEFDEMQDVHEFFPLLRRHDVTRRSALDLLEERYVRKLSGEATRKLLESAAAAAMPIMCFVGNRGCIQIHSGPVTNIKVMGPWLNVLDPGFNLHLREDLVAESWCVRKPTRHDLITSVELYDKRAELDCAVFRRARAGQAGEHGLA